MKIYVFLYVNNNNMASIIERLEKVIKIKNVGLGCLSMHKYLEIIVNDYEISAELAVKISYIGEELFFVEKYCKNKKIFTDNELIDVMKNISISNKIIEYIVDGTDDEIDNKIESAWVVKITECDMRKDILCGNGLIKTCYLKNKYVIQNNCIKYCTYFNEYIACKTKDNGLCDTAIHQNKLTDNDKYIYDQPTKDHTYNYWCLSNKNIAIDNNKFIINCHRVDKQKKTFKNKSIKNDGDDCEYIMSDKIIKQLEIPLIENFMAKTSVGNVTVTKISYVPHFIAKTMDPDHVIW